MLTPEQIKTWLQLQPNQREGGFFAPVYQSGLTVPGTSLPGFAPTADGPRALCGGIYYFLDQSGCSVLHRVTGDMLYHFYSGDPVEMLLLYPEGGRNRTEVCLFSNDVAAGGSPMKVIPGGTWLGSRLTPGGSYALMGVTMAPGYDDADYTIGQRAELLAEYPEQQTLITLLSKAP